MTERDHLDPATLAALVDRTLDAAARAAADAHLAVCAECREVWVETSELAAEGATAAPATARPRSRRWIYGGIGLAASLVIAAGLLMQLRRDPIEASIAELVADVGTQRFTAGRLSPPFAWGEPPSAQRSGASTEPALAVQRRAIELQQFAERTRTPAAWRAAGLGLLALGKTDDAVAALEHATRDDASVSSRVDLSAAYLERWRLDGDTTEAVKALDQSRRALEREPGNAAAAFNHALALEALGMRRQAVEAWNRYLAIDDASAWADEARRHVAALESTRESDASFSSLYDEIEGRRLRTWGDAVSRNEAGPGLEDVLPLVRGAGRDPWIGTVVAAASGRAPEAQRRCLARAVVATAAWRVAFETGNSEAALRAADEARVGFRCAGLPDADARARRSVSLLELSRLDEADREARGVIDSSDGGMHPRAHARALQIRGLAAFQRGRLSEAVGYVSAAVRAASAGGDAELATALRTILASLHDQQGDTRQSWAHLRHALAGVGQTSSVRRRYAILSSAAGRAAALSLDGAGLTFADALIAETAGWANPVGRAVGHLQRAEMYDRLDRIAVARADIEAAEALVPMIDSPAVRQDLEARAAFYRGLIERDHGRAVQSLTRALEEFQRTENSIAAAPALLARGRAHRDAGRIDAAREDWLRGLTVIEDQRASIRDAQLRVSRLDRAWDLYEELIDLERASPLTALEFAERGRARQLLDAMAPTKLEPLAGRALLEAVPRGAIAVVYACLRDELLIWQIRDGDIRLDARPVSRDRLAALVDDYRASILAGGDGASPALADLVLPAAPDLPRGATVYFAPDGPLHALPFAALRRSRTEAFLVERVTPVIIASLSAAAAAPAPARDSSVLLVGVAEAAGAGLPALPGVVDETRQLSALYPSALTLEDAAATRAAVVQGLRDRALVHFAGHAVVEPRFPSRSRLLLANGDRLTVAEIAAARLRRGAVVVLSACDTASGTVARGEGAAALSRAFLSAGAASVIGTLWRVRDRDATSLLTAVHRALARSASAAASLVDAQRAAIGGRAAPSAWAAFTSSGGFLHGESTR